MMAMTIIVALLGAACVLTLRPGRALGVLVMSMFLWPEYMRIPMGLAQMSAPRLIAIVFLVRLLMGRRPGFRFGRAEWIVLVWWVWDVLAHVLAGSEASETVYAVGRGMDTVLMFFVARLALTDIQAWRGLFWPLGVTALVMGVVGGVEAVGGEYLYQRLYDLSGGAWFDKGQEYRYGLLRARASTGHAIYFGVAMTVIMGWLIALRRFAPSMTMWLTAVCAAVAGTLSSLSSGPMLALTVFVGLRAFFHMRSLIRPALMMLIAMCLVLEFASNRHFYNLIDYISISQETAWYRTRLLEVAASRIGEYWAVGVGSDWPHHWGEMIDGRLHVDVVNNYVIMAISGGLLGLGLYLALQILCVSRVVRAFREGGAGQRELWFSMGALLLSLMAASMSVGLYGPPLLLSYLVMGGMASSTAASRGATARGKIVGR